MHIFDILGPVMVGPSSSHTAGAVRIGLITRALLREKPKTVEIFLHGSFAATGKGHGTDRALIAGLLGMKPDDVRIPDSFSYAKKEGISFSFQEKNLKDAHPNSVLLCLKGENGGKLELQAASIGGGQIQVQKLDGMEVNFSAQKPTLIIHNQDRPGQVAEVAAVLSEQNINIATMQLYRDVRRCIAVMVLETDQPVLEASVRYLSGLSGLLKVTYFDGQET